VELVSYSDDQYGNATTNRPFFQNVLAFAALWRGIPCFDNNNAPPVPNESPRPTPVGEAAAKCDDLFLVSAKTGKPIGLAYTNMDPPT
jgi:hypothetical protein